MAIQIHRRCGKIIISRIDARGSGLQTEVTVRRINKLWFGADVLPLRRCLAGGCAAKRHVTAFICQPILAAEKPRDCIVIQNAVVQGANYGASALICGVSGNCAIGQAAKTRSTPDVRC